MLNNLPVKKLSFAFAAAIIFTACNPSAPITGTDTQKAEKLSQIIASGGSASCTVTNLTDKTTTEITVSGKKMKFVGSDFGQGKKGTMINDTVYSYFWSEGEKTGFKTKLVTPTGATVTPSTQTNEANPEKQAEVYNDETKYKVDCSNRSVSPSEFVPPADVKFTDFSEINKMSPEELQKAFPSQAK